MRRIFQDYVAGVGVNRIAARLNDDGVRTRLGATFSARSILAVLPNRTYLGEICLKGGGGPTCLTRPLTRDRA